MCAFIKRAVGRQSAAPVAGIDAVVATLFRKKPRSTQNRMRQLFVDAIGKFTDVGTR